MQVKIIYQMQNVIPVWSQPVQSGVCNKVLFQTNMSECKAFPKRLHVRLAKTQVSLCIRAVWSESLQGNLWVATDPKRHQEDSEDWSVCTDAQANPSLRWAHMQSRKKSCTKIFQIISPCVTEPGYTLTLHTVKIQISWVLKKPTDLDLHCLPFSMWI